MKPRLRKAPHGLGWSCTLGSGSPCYGSTPVIAYLVWQYYEIDAAAMTYEGEHTLDAYIRDRLRGPIRKATFPAPGMLTGTGFAVEPRRLPADPCPQCMPGGTCATVSCGRKCSSGLMVLYGAPLGASTEPSHCAEVK